MSESLSISTPAAAGRLPRTQGVPPAVIWIAAGSVVRGSVEPVLTGLGLAMRWAPGAADALSELLERPAAICLLDCTRSGDALRIARSVRAEQPRAVLIGIVDPSRPESTLDAFRAGVFDVLPWPIVPWDLSALLANAQDLAELSAQGPPERVEVSPYGVFGTSPAIRKVIELLPRVAPSRCPIVLYGERGTGREMLARAIHGHGRRADAGFVSLDCSSTTPQDIEDELFGCVAPRRAGGAEERRSAERITTESKLYRASGGTLFLMNLPEMPARVQAKLHRVLRDREVAISSERRRVELDIRPIAAVEPGFEAVVEEGRLRRDLYERLSLIRIELPPLRQRREDVPFLANYFLKEICRAHGMPLKTVTRSGVTLLAALPWRGNAPELRAVLERLVLLTPHGSIRLEDVLAQVRIDGSEVTSAGGMSLRDARLRFERDYIAGVVRQHHGRMGEAAAALGIQRTNLYRKLRQLSVVRQDREPRR
jgi:DNA-binding NtrC family response regulator